MSVERIESLHQEASEHYLQGRFREAIEAWRRVLALDPANEQALEGVRMSSLLSEGAEVEASPVAVAAPQVDSLDAEIDAGLKVFEFDAVEPPVGDLPDPARQAEGIDFGDLDGVDAIPLDGAGGPGAEPPSAEEIGLAPVVTHVPGVDPAVAELNRRVRALLDEAKGKAASGDAEGALAVLARVHILDEDNAEAVALEGELRDASARWTGEVDRWMTEGVQAFEGGMLDEARGWFVKVLDRIPDHAEAVHYLKRIGTPSEPAASPAAEPEPNDLLASFLSSSDPVPAESAFPEIPIRAAMPDKAAPAPEAAPMRPRAARASFSPAPPAPTWSRRGPLLGLAALALLVVAGSVFLFLRGEGNGSGGASAPAPVPRAAAAATKAQTPARRPTEPSVPPLSASLARGREAMEARDFDAAVLAYNDALRADPANAEAQRGMALATESYKAVKAQHEQIAGIRSAFEDGEYASALRVIYRLPDTFDRAMVDRWKANGWFNLGVVALRAGEVQQAIQHFDEVLAIREEPETQKWKSFARRYETLPKDRAYYAATDSIRFRRLDD
jgi:tetratricopeptide (TPR) repeat protein